MQIFFVCRKLSFRKGRFKWICRGIFNIGTMLKKKAILERQFLQNTSRFRFFYGIGIPEHDTEGRVITLEYKNFFLVTVYTPNSQTELKRLDYRMRWEDDFKNYLLNLSQKKGVIVCGDLNVAHKEIDIKNPASNRHNAGFTDEERSKMTQLLESGFTDSFRFFYPDTANVYSWWSYRFHAREKNAGWRIDYFLVSNSLKSQMKSSAIHTEIFGSDHCPVELVCDCEI